LSYSHYPCFVSGCKNPSTVRIKVSSQDEGGKFRIFCEVKYLCSMHYKNIGRMRMKGALPVILENWN
jgi:hypothetical protein